MTPAGSWVHVLTLGAVLACLAGCKREELDPPEPAGTAEASYATEHRIPACRFAGDLPHTVWATASLALESINRAHPTGSPAIAINTPNAPPGSIHLDVILEAHEDQVASDGCPQPSLARSSRPLDSLSVRGVCMAEKQHIVCSAGAVRAILAAEGPRQVSPTLFILFAHELAHLALKHTGTYVGSGAILDFAAAPKAKVRTLQSACRRDRTQLDQETRADELSLAAARERFQQEPFRGPGESAMAAVATNFELVYQTSLSLQEWSASVQGQTGAIQAPEQDVCLLMKQGQGRKELAIMGGGHPHSWVRLAAVVSLSADTLAELGQEGEAWRDEAPFAEMNALGGRIRAEAMEQFSQRFCAQVNEYAAGVLQCPP